MRLTTNQLLNSFIVGLVMYIILIIVRRLAGADLYPVVACLTVIALIGLLLIRIAYLKRKARNRREEKQEQLQAHMDYVRNSLNRYVGEKDHENDSN